MNPAALLLLGVVRHQLWEHSSHPALVWNALGSLVMCCLMYASVRGQKGLILWTVVAWWLYEEALVMICSTWRMFDWWPVAPGEEQCSSLVGVHLGAVSMVIVAWLAAILATTPNNKGQANES